MKKPPSSKPNRQRRPSDEPPETLPSTPTGGDRPPVRPHPILRVDRVQPAAASETTAAAAPARVLYLLDLAGADGIAPSQLIRAASRAESGSLGSDQTEEALDVLLQAGLAYEREGRMFYRGKAQPRASTAASVEGPPSPREIASLPPDAAARVLMLLEVRGAEGADPALLMTSLRRDAGLSPKQTEAAVRVLLGAGLAVEREDRIFHAHAPTTGPASAVDPGPEPSPSARKRERRLCLHSLAIQAMGHPGKFDMEALHELSVEHLFAIAWNDNGGELDPVAEMMRNVSDDLDIWACLTINVEELEIVPRDEVMHRFISRLTHRARIAAELHDRQREALFDVIDGGAA